MTTDDRIAAESRITSGTEHGRPLATDDERNELEALSALVDGFLDLARPARPLCIGVFGPPGAGKSFGVKRTLKALAAKKKRRLELTTINLTQIGTTEELGGLLSAQMDARGSGGVPCIMFDEFDAPMGGAPMGWMSWFLAPMHDGHFFHAGHRVDVSTALFFFAGGTAPNLAAFERNPDPKFRLAKGPDFVSRLRGYLDVHGPNASDFRDLRRAEVIHHVLGDIAEARTGQEGALRSAVDPTLARQLLDVGRYRHGARSISALLEMIEMKAAGSTLTVEHLPEPHLVAMHVDRGPLDPRTIGGPVGLSGGGKGDLDDIWKRLGREVWKDGGCVAYGGDLREGGLVDQLVGEVAKLPQPLHPQETRGSSDESKDDGVHDDAPYVALFLRALSPDLPKIQGLIRRGHVQVVASPTLLPRTDQPQWLAMMRWRMACRCVALICVGGKTEGWSGRMPGIIEEAMFHIALRKPIYVLGGVDGAARALGAALGLAAEGATIPAVETREVTTAASAIRGASELPSTTSDAVDWLVGSSIGGPNWTDNGLGIEENRELFRTTNADDIVKFIRLGLMRRFGTH